MVLMVCVLGRHAQVTAGGCTSGQPSQHLGTTTVLCIAGERRKKNQPLIQLGYQYIIQVVLLERRRQYCRASTYWYVTAAVAPPGSYRWCQVPSGLRTYTPVHSPRFAVMTTRQTWTWPGVDERQHFASYLCYEYCTFIRVRLYMRPDFSRTMPPHGERYAAHRRLVLCMV